MHRFVIFALAVGIFLVPCFAQVQPGSIGGSIGKTDKSISGGESAAEPRPSTKRRIERGASDSSSGVSVAGRWGWIADCTSGHWQGQFDLTEISRGQFNGSFDPIGTISNGRVNGTSVTFTRTWVTGTQYWTGQLAAGRLKDTLSGNERCSWQASRK